MSLDAPDCHQAPGVAPIEPHRPVHPTPPLPELLALLGADTASRAADAPPRLPLWRVRAGSTLVLEGARVDFIHLVRSGSLKCVRVWDDGYEQVLSLADRGDLIGFESLSRQVHLSSVVALEDASVFALPVQDLGTLRQRYPRFDGALQLAISRQLAGACQIAEMLAPVGAEVRLARFLVWYASRMAERGESPRRFRLRMPRRDLASLLGVAHETVSRSFSVMAGSGVLRVDNREIEILDPDGLQACTRTTRSGPLVGGPRGPLSWRAAAARAAAARAPAPRGAPVAAAAT